MAHFAKLNENNIVIEVHCVANAALDSLNEEQSGIEFLTNWSGGYTNWVQTSYNGTIRKNYAAAGYTYDADRDAFIAPEPVGNLGLDENTCQWIMPAVDYAIGN
jgi:hypothetical protein